MREVPQLYTAGVGEVLRVISGEGRATKTLLVVGHQPWLSGIVKVLSGGGSVSVPTAALIRLEITGDWAEIGPGRGVVTALIPPRMLVESGPGTHS